MQVQTIAKKSRYARSGWPTGYGTTLPADVRLSLKQYKQTNLSRTVLTALLDLLTICVAAMIDNRFFSKAAVFWLPLHIITLVIIARSQRGLECLVHEGSHYNWSRCGRRNDLLVNLLSALPVFSLVKRYREGHRLHHTQFGSGDDPDRQRYEQLKIDDLDRSSARAFIQGIAKRLPRYILSWWKAIGLSPAAFLYALAWHAVFVLPLAVIIGIQSSLMLWLKYWLLPIMFVLPVIRFIGEAGEHIYRNNDKVFAATVSNYGFAHRWLIHPHQDGYHLLHHLMPSVPHFSLKRAHELLSAADPINYGLRQRYRLHLLQQPFGAEKLSPNGSEESRESVA
jgi:fatty acid desaturase